MSGDIVVSLQRCVDRSFHGCCKVWPAIQSVPRTTFGNHLSCQEVDPVFSHLAVSYIHNSVQNLLPCVIMCSKTGTVMIPVLGFRREKRWFEAFACESGAEGSSCAKPEEAKEPPNIRNASKYSICGAFIERKASQRARARKFQGNVRRASPRSDGGGRSERPRSGER